MWTWTIYFHSSSQSCPILSANCKYNLRLFCLFRGDSSGMDKSWSAKCLLYSGVVKGEPSPTERGRRRSRDEKGNQGVGDFRFKNLLQFFSTYFFSVQLLYLITFFLYFFYSQHLPKPSPTTHTHDPRPLPTTHDPRPTTFNHTQLFGEYFSVYI